MPRTAVREMEETVADVEPVVLAVGDLFSLKVQMDGRRVADAAFADFADVDAELIRSLRPNLVISAMLARNFDCVDLAERLSTIGFEGSYRLLSHGVPQPELVLHEIRSLFPDLRIELEPSAG